MKRINLRPLDDRVVVEPVEAEEMTAGGIVLPDTAKEKPQRGIVLAIGPGKLLDSGERGEQSVASFLIGVDTAHDLDCHQRGRDRYERGAHGGPTGRDQGTERFRVHRHSKGNLSRDVHQDPESPPPAAGRLRWAR